MEGRTERSNPRFQYGHEDKLSADIGVEPNPEEERVYGDMAVNPEGGDLRFQSEGRMQKHSGKDQAFLCGDTLPRGSNSSSARQWMKLNGKMVEVQVVEPEPRFLDGHESLENGKIEARLEPCQGVEDERFQHNIPGGENMTKGDDARDGGSSGVEKDESPRTLWHDRRWV